MSPPPLFVLIIGLHRLQAHTEKVKTPGLRDPIEITKDTLGGIWPVTISRPVSKELSPRCSSMPVLRGTT